MLVNSTAVAKDPTVGYVVKRFPRLSETFIINELRTLCAMGCQPIVFSLSDPEPEQQQHLLSELDLPVIYLSAAKQFNKTQLRTVNYGRQTDSEIHLKSLIDAATATHGTQPGKSFAQSATLRWQATVLSLLANLHSVEHLHAHFASDAATVAMLASQLSGIAFSMTAHAKDIFHTYSDAATDRAWLKQKLDAAKFTVTVSDYNRDYLQALAPQANIIRLYNGIDLHRFQVDHSFPEPNLLVAVGRLVEKKGFNHLLSACALLRERNIPWRLQLIGDGPLAADLKQQAEALNIASHIEFIGSVNQNQVMHYLRQATAFVLPCVVSSSGDRDGLPTVLLEAMALAKPVISTRLAGIPEMIADGHSGWLTEPENPQQLADTLQSVLAMNYGARRSIGLNARKRTEQLFDITRNVAVLRDLFFSNSLRQQQVSGAAQ